MFWDSLQTTRIDSVPWVQMVKERDVFCGFCVADHMALWVRDGQSHQRASVCGLIPPEGTCLWWLIPVVPSYPAQAERDGVALIVALISWPEESFYIWLYLTVLPEEGMLENFRFCFSHNAFWSYSFHSLTTPWSLLPSTHTTSYYLCV